MVKYIIGTLLLPALLITIYVTLYQLSRVFTENVQVLGYFMLGFFSYILFQKIFKKPMYLYVFGHEITHAIAGLISGFKIKRVFISSKNGNVILNNINLFTALSPYCFPFYTILILICFKIISLFTSLIFPPEIQIFLIGFSYAFHIVLTLYALIQNQPDLKIAGKYLSLILIMLLNFIILFLLMKIFFPKLVSIKSFINHWVEIALILINWIKENIRV